MAIEYVNNNAAPAILRYQNARGITLAFLRSDAIHWTTQRMKKMPWPKKPIPNQIISVVVIMKMSGIRCKARGGRLPGFRLTLHA